MIKLIKQGVELIPKQPLLQAIEAAARTCYKSEDKITAESASPFVKMLVSRGHTAMLEHGTVYLKFYSKSNLQTAALGRIVESRYSVVNDSIKGSLFITTNLRVILEACNNNLDEALQVVETWGVPEDKRFEKRVSFRIICDRGITHELVRHRVFSFAQESTRYVRYGDKQPMQFICPAWWPHGEGIFVWNPADQQLERQADVTQEPGVVFTTKPLEATKEQRNAASYVVALGACAQVYSELLFYGQTPQQARAVLPNSLKTEIVMTGTLAQWKEFLVLRDCPAAHPDMQPIARQIALILEEMSKEGEC